MGKEISFSQTKAGDPGIMPSEDAREKSGVRVSDNDVVDSILILHRSTVVFPKHVNLNAMEKVVIALVSVVVRVY